MFIFSHSYETADKKCDGCSHRQCLSQYFSDFESVLQEPGTIDDYKMLLENLKLKMTIDEVHRYRLTHELNTYKHVIEEKLRRKLCCC